MVAGPRPLPGISDQSGAHRVLEKVRHRGRQMGLVHGDGTIPALPEMSGAAFAIVDDARIGPVDAG